MRIFSLCMKNFMTITEPLNRFLTDFETESEFLFTKTVQKCEFLKKTRSFFCADIHFRNSQQWFGHKVSLVVRTIHIYKTSVWPDDEVRSLSEREKCMQLIWFRIQFQILVSIVRPSITITFANVWCNAKRSSLIESSIWTTHMAQPTYLIINTVSYVELYKSTKSINCS